MRFVLWQTKFLVTTREKERDEHKQLDLSFIGRFRSLPKGKAQAPLLSLNREFKFTFTLNVGPCSSLVDVEANLNVNANVNGSNTSE